MIITRDEVKSFLRLENNWIDKESVDLTTCNYERLANKYVGSIERVDTDTAWSTASAYDTNDYYTTEDYQKYTLLRRIDTGAIGTTETVYVSYSYNSYNSIIDMLIPLVENDLISFLNNDFTESKTACFGNFSFIERSGTSQPQIKDTQNKAFLIYGFQDEMDIYVKGTERNQNKYYVTDASSEILKLSSNDTILEENSTDQYGGNIIYVNRIKWPPELKRIVASIIWENITIAKQTGVQSKSLGPSSVSYMALAAGGYSDNVYKALNRYKNTYCK